MSGLFTRIASAVISVRAIASSSRSIHTSSALNVSWGGGKLKTHTGTAKRFKPVGRRQKATRSEIQLLPTGDLVSYSPLQALGPMFKRGRTGKRHLNTKMTQGQASRLKGTLVHESGHTIRTLNRLIGSHF